MGLSWQENLKNLLNGGKANDDHVHGWCGLWLGSDWYGISQAEATERLGGFECVLPRRLAIVNRRLLSQGASQRLEPCAGKLAGTVLRGRGRSNAILLPDQ